MPDINLAGAVPLGGRKRNEPDPNVYCPHPDLVPGVGPNGLPGFLNVPSKHSWAQYFEPIDGVSVPVGFFCTGCLMIMKPTAEQVQAALDAGHDGPVRPQEVTSNG